MSSDRGNAKLKFFDAWLGPVFLRFLSFFKSRKKVPLNFPKIGLIKAAAIGDTLLMSALLTDLRRHFPESKIHLFVGKSNLGIAQLLKDVDQIHELPLKSPVKSILQLREVGCDLLIDVDTWPRISALWAALAGARWTLGFKTEKQHRHYCFDQTVDHNSQVHEIENYRNLLRALQIPTESAMQDFSWIAKPLPKSSKIALHLWPGGTESHLKEWPLENWKKLILELAKDSGLVFALTGGPGDRERNEKLLASLPSEVRQRLENKAGINLKETIQLLASVKALISVNTGILHLGAALRIPVLGLHGPTNPLRWGPLGTQNVSVISSHPQAGCLNLGFEYSTSENLMESLSLEEVLRGLKELSLKNNLGLKIIH